MLAPGPFGLGLPELIIILVVILLIFGASRLADIGGALGKSIREFRRAAREPDEPETAPAQETTEAGRTCTSCGARIERDAKFCPECGTSMQATVRQ